MGKTRDLFKKIRDTKGTLHAKMGTIKDRNHMDFTEALRGLQETRVATREESGVLGFPSRRGLTP